MICEILRLTENGQVLAGRILLNRSKITAQPEKGYPVLLDNIINEPMLVDKKLMVASDDPARWFRALPKVYTGSYQRAHMAAEEML
jgi:hypothetical protein